jgi:hypothetical protein
MRPTLGAASGRYRGRPNVSREWWCFFVGLMCGAGMVLFLGTAALLITH